MLGFLAGKTSIAALLTLSALAAGVQALAPASAGAVANQLTDCTPGSGINGYGIDRSGTLCYLGGGEVIEVDEGPCSLHLCLPDEVHIGGGGGGREAGYGNGPVTRPGPVVKAKQRENEKTKADPRKLCNVTLARSLYLRQKEFDEFLDRASESRTVLRFYYPPWPEGSDSEPDPMTASEVEKLAGYVRTLRTMKAGDSYPPTIALPLQKDPELKAIGQEFWRNDCKQFRGPRQAGR